MKKAKSANRIDPLQTAPEPANRVVTCEEQTEQHGGDHHMAEDQDVHAHPASENCADALDSAHALQFP
ncbi:MAG: hypothetical protein ABGY71_14720 [bacterium]